MKRLGRLVLVIFAVGVQSRAEVVQFKNGDQLTGTWLRMNENKMVFKSDTLGEVSIPMSAVKSMASTKQAVILAKDGKAFSGMPSVLESGDWELRGDNGGTRHVPAASVVAIYPTDVYMSKAGETTVRPWRNWKGSGNVGYSLVRGERDAGTLSIAVDATRRQPDLPGLQERFRTNYLLTVLYANTRTDGIKTSANSVSTSLRQDFLVTPSDFLFVLGQWDHIQTQSLNLRQTYGAGLGRDLLRRPRIQMQMLGGITFVRESFQNAELRRNATALLGEKLTWKLSNAIVLGHSLDFYPSITDAGEFRVDSTSTLSTRITSRLSFNTTFADRLLSRPLPGRQRNEVILTTGLGFNF
jgi:putative salt-induced outer membrane protein YdiY